MNKRLILLLVLTVVAVAFAVQTVQGAGPVPPHVEEVVAKHALRAQTKVVPGKSTKWSEIDKNLSSYVDELSGDEYVIDTRRDGKLWAYYRSSKVDDQGKEGDVGKDPIEREADKIAREHFDGGSARLAKMRREVIRREAGQTGVKGGATHSYYEYQVQYTEYAGEVRTPTYFVVAFDAADGEMLWFQQDVVEVRVPLTAKVSAQRAEELAADALHIPVHTLDKAELWVWAKIDGTQELVWSVTMHTGDGVSTGMKGEVRVDAQTGELVMVSN